MSSSVGLRTDGSFDDMVGLVKVRNQHLAIPAPSIALECSQLIWA
jgi:hypothetical protein